MIVHVGDPGTIPLSIMNAATNDGFSENLHFYRVKFKRGFRGEWLDQEVIAPGQTNTDIALTFSTATADVLSGQVTIDSMSDGTGIDGLPPLDLGLKTFNETVTVNNLAQAAFKELSGDGSFSGSGNNFTLDLGTVNLNSDPLSVEIGVQNVAVGPADYLAGSFSTQGDPEFSSNSFTDFSRIDAGQQTTAGEITFDPSNVGTFSETVVLDSQGKNDSGYSGALAPETLTITGTVESEADPQINNDPIDFGKLRENDPATKQISVTNDATPPADSLDAEVTGFTPDVQNASGSFTDLAAGATDDSSLSVGLDTTGWEQSGSVTVAFDSNNGESVTPLDPQTVSVQGTVYREADGIVTGPDTPQIFHVGDNATTHLTVLNSAAADGFSEGLLANVTGSSGSITADGATGLIAAGASDSSSLTVTFDTSQAQNIDGTVDVGLQSDGAGTSGFAPTDIEGQTVSVSATVNNFGNPVLQYDTLNLGPVMAGDPSPFTHLSVLNDVTGPADDLSGTFSISGDAAFINSGFDPFSGVGAQELGGGGMFSLDTTTPGTYFETINLFSTGYNGSGASSCAAGAKRDHRRHCIAAFTTAAFTTAAFTTAAFTTAAFTTAAFTTADVATADVATSDAVPTTTSATAGRTRGFTVSVFDISRPSTGCTIACRRLANSCW